MNSRAHFEVLRGKYSFYSFIKKEKKSRTFGKWLKQIEIDRDTAIRKYITSKIQELQSKKLSYYESRLFGLYLCQDMTYIEHSTYTIIMYIFSN